MSFYYWTYSVPLPISWYLVPCQCESYSPMTILRNSDRSKILSNCRIPPIIYVCEVFCILDFAYSVCIFGVKFFAFLDFGYSFYILSSVHLVSIDSQIMFKDDLDYVSLDPGLPWLVVKNVQTHIWMGGHCVVIIPGHSVW